MKVRDIGMKEIYCATPTMSLNEIASMMKRHGVGAMPVCDGNKLVGMIIDRDLVVSCVAAGIESGACLAKEFMTTNL